ncbi:MAG: glutamate--tRNA ligase [Campylobacter sp.]|uniref:glutamate--tRNA ligase n=1 Tax=Campylobacter sp. TaxID=205 RepID=UPI002A829278|nr:glutamate--tRNA ligase [Campylobacter sp.]MCI7586826.1 glutamate--tRNA ligase [Campylobacter sp.]MDY5114887.1 glutamate--tRNA ligase [Campylobacter sp.]
MIVTRFAPSPTGFLHVGGLRTALYNYLYARKNGGKFLLRIEDTDLDRNRDEAVEAIKEAFEWCGLEYDGEVEFQSRRTEIYKKYINELLESGKAYKCYMSKDELDALRKEQEARKERPKYDGRYRDFTGTPPEGIEPVIRIKAPLLGKIEFDDGIKGHISFEAADILDDFIIARSDGSPTYNFTVVIDDALMGVSDVIRGDDHLSNTPKQIILYDALGFKVPRFYHVAMINGSDGSKLSKRHGATDVMEYKRMGYLPQALLNFLVRLGWGHGDNEIFSMSDMLRLFDPKDINKSASTYNLSKLEWLNAYYIKNSGFYELADEMLFFGIDFRALPKGELLMSLLQERAKTLLDIKAGVELIVNAPSSYDEKAMKKFVNDESKALLAQYLAEFKEGLENTSEFEHFTMEFLNSKGKTLKDLAQNVRIALTGGSVSPGIFEMMEVLGASEVKKRILEFLKA